LTSLIFVDDHTLVRQSLVRVVSAEPGLDVVAETGDGDEAIALIARWKPDVVVLDINLPGTDGFGVAAAARLKHPGLRVIFVTMHEDDAHIRRAMQMGADGYVPKTSPARELIQAIHIVAAGGSYLAPAIAGRVIGLAGRRAGVSGALSDRELEILELLASGARVPEVAAQVYLSVKTVKNHLTSIYAKLNVNSAPQAMAEAYRLGLVSPPTPTVPAARRSL
jgi:DNA-binding NarL/FixJ family response regulator